MLDGTAGRRALYNQGGVSIISSRVFFSLFQWVVLPAGGGNYAVGDDASRSWMVLEGSPPRLTLTAPGANYSSAQPFWPSTSRREELECSVLHVDYQRTVALGQSAQSPAILTTVPSSQASCFHFQRVIQHAHHSDARRKDQAPLPHEQQHVWRRQPHVDLKLGGRETFAQRVRRSTTRMGGRSFVLVTYHNVGMLDWAVLFWKWLHNAGLQRFMLLELDGLTCDAARELNCPLRFECATGRDMTLPRAYTEIHDASSMQEWGTDATSGYFKFLRWKLCIVELLLTEQVDVLMADVDVLVLSPSYFTTLASSPYDLTISSDARHGRYNDNPHCPCSHSMYQRYSADWVCAGNFYIRSTRAAQWFMREVQALMDKFVITDQDAIQAVLTGHTQVAVPQMTTNESEAAKLRGEAVAFKRGYRPSPAWLKPTWLEGLDRSQTLRNTRGIQPLNTPMRLGMWRRVSERRRESGFTWTAAPVSSFANGPMLIDRWEAHFNGSAIVPIGQPGRDSSGFVSVHANCNVKSFLMMEEHSGSWLLHPPDAPHPHPQPTPTLV